MVKYSISQRVEILQIYYANSCSVTKTFRELKSIYGENHRPSERYIYNLIQKFETTGTVTNQPVPVRKRSGRSMENIEAVRESVESNPTLSVEKRSQLLGLSVMTTWRILRNDLNLIRYKTEIECLEEEESTQDTATVRNTEKILVKEEEEFIKA